MKNILQKLYYYSPYIPIIGLLIMIITLPWAYKTCIFDKNLNPSKHFIPSMLVEGIFGAIIFTVIILLTINK